MTAAFKRDSALGIVTDNKTALQWQDNSIVGPMDWYSAVEYCNNLILDGKGWRLPSIEALETIIDSTKEPAVADHFRQTISKHYWSSTTSKNEDYRANYIDFFSGRKDSHNKSYAGYVRCVRPQR